MQITESNLYLYFFFIGVKLIFSATINWIIEVRVYVTCAFMRCNYCNRSGQVSLSPGIPGCQSDCLQLHPDVSRMQTTSPAAFQSTPISPSPQYKYKIQSNSHIITAIKQFVLIKTENRFISYEIAIVNRLDSFLYKMIRNILFLK